MTPEEILKKHSTELTDGSLIRPFECCIDAMKEYARQQAKDFAEWIDGKGYECFLMTDEGVKHWEVSREKGHLTTDELYTIFEEQNKSKP